MTNATHNPYTAPDASLEVTPTSFHYVGFWARVGAALIDTVLIVAITLPLLYWIYGRDYFDSTGLIQGPLDFLISYIAPAVAIIVFWVYRSATPGKMAIGARIVDARSGTKPSVGQLLGRYLAYYPSSMLLGLGLMWVGWDARKQGWHDKLAGTLVVRDKH